MLAVVGSVTIQPHHTDRYGRTVAEVILPDGRTPRGTHAMKAAYALLRSARDYEAKGHPEARSPSVQIGRAHKKLAGVFRPKGGQVGRLVRGAPGRGRS